MFFEQVNVHKRVCQIWESSGSMFANGADYVNDCRWCTGGLLKVNSEWEMGNGKWEMGNGKWGGCEKFFKLVELLFSVSVLILVLVPVLSDCG
jgi:hypothetical protein